MTTWRQLMDDPRTQEAIDSLLERGFPETQVMVFLHHLEALPKLVKLHCEETAKQKAKRRHELAKKVRRLALAIEQDTEAQHYRIFDHESITTTPLGDRPPVFEFLRDFAGEVERSEGKFADALDAYSPEVRSTRSTKKQFTVNEMVAVFLELIGEPVATRPLNPLAKLARVVLGDDGVTEQNVKDAFRKAEKDRGWN